VLALNLARGDQTGMWMLNYAFPYKDERVKRQFESLSRLLAEAVETGERPLFQTRLAAYLKAREGFQAQLAADDYRYFSFQVWQEGIARYTEYRVAELAARRYRPSRDFRALGDYRPFAEVAAEIRRNLLRELRTLKLDQYERVAFYPLGAGEGLLLDRTSARWQKSYFENKFYVEKYFIARR
jgi:hypothetical protein